MRTDENNNPTAFTTAIAQQAGLDLGLDYAIGTPFRVGMATFYTAKLKGDPIELTIRVIDELGFYNSDNRLRWVYIAIPYFIWKSLTKEEKIKVIGFMYENEGGTLMKSLFVEPVPINLNLSDELKMGDKVG